MSTALRRERCGSTTEASLPATKIQRETGCLANATRGEKDKPFSQCITMRGMWLFEWSGTLEREVYCHIKGITEPLADRTALLNRK